MDSPSENWYTGGGKILSNIGYSIVDAPVRLFGKQTLGGRIINNTERTYTFVDFAPGLLSLGLTKTGQVVKTTKKALPGCNQFVERSPGITSSEGLPKGMKWQTHVGQLYQKNKISQQGLKDFSKSRKTLDLIDNSSEELNK